MPILVPNLYSTAPLPPGGGVQKGGFGGFRCLLSPLVSSHFVDIAFLDPPFAEKVMQNYQNKAPKTTMTVPIQVAELLEPETKVLKLA